MLTIAYPWIAFVIGGAFFAAWRWRRARSAAVAGVLWSLYGIYECLIYARVICSGDCNIRVDLLLIYPVLFVMSLVAVWNSVRIAVTPTGQESKLRD